MAALNFPDPNVQTSYTNPDTGIAYEWANGLWKAVRTAQTAPELFVDADGDNLTGNLTLGTDKIVLDATTGAAAFAGGITSGGDQVLETGSLNVYQSANSGSTTVFNGGWSVGGRNITSSIFSNGSAKFGPLNISSSTGYGAQVEMLANAATVNAQCQQTASPLTLLFAGYQGANRNFHVTAAGAAEFAGTIQSTDYPTTGYQLESGGSLGLNAVAGTSGNMFALAVGGTQVAGITGEGIATFASEVTVGDRSSNSNPYTRSSAGSVIINNPSIVDALRILKSGTEVISLSTDGSATFASGTSNAAGVEISKNNSNASYAPLYLKQANTSGNLITGRDDFNGVNTFTVSATGSATFAGGVTTTDLFFITHSATSAQVLATARGPASNNDIYLRGEDQNGNATWGIESKDGSAVFADEKLKIDDRGTITRPGAGGNYYSLGAFNDSGTTTGSAGGRLVLKTDAAGSVDTETIVLNGQSGNATFAGNVDIGTTSASQNGPILKVGTVNNTGSCIRTFVDYFHTRTHIDFFNGSTQQGSITGLNSSVSYNTSSDYRLKENVIDITDGITRVKQLQPKRFNFIAYADTTVDGFLAHEAQSVVPEAVTGTKDEVDDEGNAVMQGIDQSKLVPLLTAALQEAIAEIETLKVKVAALEAN